MILFMYKLFNKKRGVNKMAEEKKTKKEKEMEELKKELKEELKKEMYEEMNNKKQDNKSFEEKAKDAFDKIMDTDDNTKEYEKNDIEQNKIFAILSYFGPLCLVPYFVSKESRFAMFHAKQGLNLFIIEFAVSIISYFLISIFEFSKMCNVGGIEYICGTYIPIWIDIPLDFAGLILGIISLIGLIYACQGKAKEVPILGKIKIVK